MTMAAVQAGHAEPVFITPSGEALQIDASGIAYAPAHDTLIVADLHLEKSSSHARHGRFLPPYDTAATLARLASVIRQFDPASVVALGDSFHDATGHDRLDSAALDCIATMAQGRDWIWIAGNHDPAPLGGLPGRCMGEIGLGRLVLRHEPRPGRQSEIAGHLHPAAKVVHAGRSIRKRAFISDANRLILPAFGSLTGALNCRHRAFAGLFDPQSLRVHMAGEARVFEVPASALVD